MSRLTKILILLVIVLIIAALIVWFVFLRSANKAVVPSINTPINAVVPTAGTGSANINPSKIAIVPALPAKENKKAEISGNLVKIASSFSERFGSFSNQESDYNNIRDLQIFMTDSMKKWSENFIRDSRAKAGDNSIYYGITTKALSTDILKFDDQAGKAEIIVKTQRREAIGNTLNVKVYYQSIKIIIKKVDGDIWKVDGAYWQ